MSQRVDQRDPTRIELDCYNKILKLNDHVMSVCKPKDKNVNNHHIPKKNTSIGNVKVHYQSVRACLKYGARSDLVKMDKYINNIFGGLKNGN